MTPPTFRYAVHRVDGRTLALYLHTNQAPDDETWTTSMRDIAKILETVSPTEFAILVITDGGAPSTPQRRQLAEATCNARFSLAVINTSPVVRGALTAISWINPSIKPFAPGKFAEACTYCGLSNNGAVEMLAAMKQLQAQLATPVKCLADAEA